MVLTKVLEDCTGEYQFGTEVDKKHEAEVFNAFYNLWDDPESRGIIIKHGSIDIAFSPMFRLDNAYQSISKKWEDHVAKFEMVRSSADYMTPVTLEEGEAKM